MARAQTAGDQMFYRDWGHCSVCSDNWTGSMEADASRTNLHALAKNGQSAAGLATDKYKWRLQSCCNRQW